MDNIREIFAKNLRESRRKPGLTQAQLAELESYPWKIWT
jgi:DNA-binding XRE family transcriptional regulator